jgi:hypothetical protein
VFRISDTAIGQPYAGSVRAWDLPVCLVRLVNLFINQPYDLYGVDDTRCQ